MRRRPPAVGTPEWVATRAARSRRRRGSRALSRSLGHLWNSRERRARMLGRTRRRPSAAPAAHHPAPQPSRARPSAVCRPRGRHRVGRRSHRLGSTPRRRHGFFVGFRVRPRPRRDSAVLGRRWVRAARRWEPHHADDQDAGSHRVSFPIHVDLGGLRAGLRAPRGRARESRLLGLRPTSGGLLAEPLSAHRARPRPGHPGEGIPRHHLRARERRHARQLEVAGDFRKASHPIGRAAGEAPLPDRRRPRPSTATSDHRPRPSTIEGPLMVAVVRSRSFRRRSRARRSSPWPDVGHDVFVPP